MSDSPRRRMQTILVVDDHPDNLMLTRELLSAKGYQVVTASSADQAQQVIRTTPPDLILLDVVMPGKSGFELCREIKENHLTRLIPIVLITGLSQREDKIRGIEAGADDFLNKPLFPEELYARVKSLLKLKEFTDEMENVETVLFTLALGVEARDPYTEGHCERLSDYGVQFGRHLKLDETSITALRRGGVLHDLGKISIPDEILKKGTNLTEDEWKVMRQHPEIGESICKPMRSFRDVLPIIRHHHEHWNGSGYPDGLRGEEIPLVARVLQIVDVYDALRTARSYKPALTHEECVFTMRDEAAAGLYQPDLVEEFFRMWLEREKAA